jgi:osmoprotectant transport system substrate-binding protein
MGFGPGASLGDPHAESGGMNRRTALGLIASASLVAGCGNKPHERLIVGSKNFTEELLLGELYAQLLEHYDFRITRKLNLGGTQVAMAALRRGDIDLYPEYTGTALITELKLKPTGDAAATYKTVRDAYARDYQLVWLDPAPMNNTQALATTQAVAEKYDITTLSELSRAAPKLRLGAIPEFTTREDGLPGLQKAYGGFNFRDVKLFDIALRYRALQAGNVDVVVAFGTDGQILADSLLVFDDDKHFWPAYQVAPVVRQEAIDRFPALVTHLNQLSARLTDKTMRELNYAIDGGKQEPATVAHDFLTGIGFV